MIVAPANAKEASGEPALRRQGRPVRERASTSCSSPSRPSTSARTSAQYVVTGSKQQELGFQEDEGTQYAAYEGADGVSLDNPLDARPPSRCASATSTRSISDQLTGDSKILYIRDIQERVEALAPFLHYDADPYPVISDGRIKWIVDAYTTTNRYPYGETAETGALADGSGLDHDFNYVRNSVKAVVDAYDGTVDFYVMPVDDPIIEAYRDAFPDLFTDFEEMPDDLKDHLRYPEDLFRVQTTMWARYHVEDPSELLRGQRLLGRRPRPRHRRGRRGHQRHQRRRARPSPPATPASTPTTCSPSSRAPTSPSSSCCGRSCRPPRRTTASCSPRSWSGKSDRDDYGKLQVFVMPRGNLPDGPAIVQGNIQSDADVSAAGDAAVRQRVHGVLREPHRPSRSTAASSTCGRST